MRRLLSKNRPGFPQKSSENSCNEGEGNQVLLCSTLNGVVAPVAFYEVVAATTVHGQDRGVRGSSHSSLSVSVLRHCSETHRLFSPSGCGCHFATPFLQRVRCRSGSQSLQKRQRLFPYCSLFCTFFVPSTHFIASLSGHWPFAGDSEASGCQPMPLRVGTPEWAYSLFLKKRSRPSCSSSSSAVRVRRVP